MDLHKMNGKERLQTLLDGGIPDVPPTWELVFQIQEAFFGMPPRDALRTKEYGSEKEMLHALWQYDFEVYERCVEELGWCPIRGGYDPEEVKFHADRINGRALVVGYEGKGIFYMPSGRTMMDFSVRLYEDPEGIQAEAREKCERAKETFRKNVDAGADVLLGR